MRLVPQRGTLGPSDRPAIAEYCREVCRALDEVGIQYQVTTDGKLQCRLKDSRKESQFVCMNPQRTYETLQDWYTQLALQPHPPLLEELPPVVRPARARPPPVPDQRRSILSRILASVSFSSQPTTDRESADRLDAKRLESELALIVGNHYRQQFGRLQQWVDEQCASNSFLPAIGRWAIAFRRQFRFVTTTRCKAPFNQLMDVSLNGRQMQVRAVDDRGRWSVRLGIDDQPQLAIYLSPGVNEQTATQIMGVIRGLRFRLTTNGVLIELEDKTQVGVLQCRARDLAGDSDGIQSA